MNLSGKTAATRASTALVAILSLVSPTSAAEKAASAPAYTLTLSEDNTVAVTLNGAPHTLLVDPDGPGLRIVNAATAKQLSLKAGMIGFAHRVGPTTLRASADGVMVGYGFVTKKDLVLWFNRDATARGDGVAGPSALPYDVVRFMLAAPQSGEKPVTLPMSKIGAFGFSGAGTLIKLGKEQVIVRFTLARDTALATAPTGQLLAASQGGSLSGETLTTMIRFGIERPTRTMTLSKPFSVGGRSVNTVAVRVSDFGDASNITDASAPARKPDEDEIIVTAEKKKKKQVHELVLGKSFLSGCSSLTYDFKQKQIQLSCL
jgi:uncharacterized membrane protein